MLYFKSEEFKEMEEPIYRCNLNRLIQLRESGLQHDALEIGLSTLIQCSERQKAELLGHIILTCEHLYVKYGNEIDLDRMAEMIEQGFKLSITPEEKAVFFLRLGKYYMLRNAPDDLGSAYMALQNAVDLVPKSGHQYWEFQGHLAEVMILMNLDIPVARSMLRASIDAISVMVFTDQKHKDVILVGLYRRISKAYWASGSYVAWLGANLFGFCLAVSLRLRGYTVHMDNAWRSIFKQSS